MISKSISYYNKNGQVTTSLNALGSLEGSMPLVTTYNIQNMIYKQDYKLVVTWDTNSNMYWMLYRKGLPVNANEEELALVKSILKI